MSGKKERSRIHSSNYYYRNIPIRPEDLAKQKRRARNKRQYLKRKTRTINNDGTNLQEHQLDQQHAEEEPIPEFDTIGTALPPPTQPTSSDYFDSKGRVRLKRAKTHIESLFGPSAGDVAAYIVLKSNLSQKRMEQLREKLRKATTNRLNTDIEHRSASLLINMSTSKRAHDELCSSISVSDTSLIVGRSTTSKKISSESTCRRTRDRCLNNIGFKIQIGTCNPAIRWVDPIPLMTLYGTEVHLFCTGIDAVEEKRGGGSSGRHANNAYLWPLQVSQGIAIHSPRANLLFIRGIKEHIKDTDGNDSLVSEFVRIRADISAKLPRVIIFHSGDSFEIKHELGVHSKLFESSYYKTCLPCTKLLSAGAPRERHVDDAKNVASHVKRFLDHLGIVEKTKITKIRCWIANITSAGQGPNCLIPQSIIDWLVPDILHLEINTVKSILVQACVMTMQSKNTLTRTIWNELLDHSHSIPNEAAQVFTQIEEFCRSKSLSTRPLNIHILGKTASEILQYLPEFFLYLRVKYFYQEDRRNNEKFRKTVNILTLIFMVLRRIFLIATQCSIRHQDEAFEKVNIWPHLHPNSAPSLLEADCQLLRSVLRSYFDPECITDTLYTVVFALPAKNELCRKYGTTVGACQMQGSEHAGGRAAFFRKNSSNHSSNLQQTYNAEGSLLRRHFLKGIARRDFSKLTTGQPSSAANLEEPNFQLRPVDGWLKRGITCILCSKVHHRADMHALCDEFSALLLPKNMVQIPAPCAHWNDIEWVLDPKNIKPPFSNAIQQYRHVFGISPPSSAPTSSSQIPPKPSRVQKNLKCRAPRKGHSVVLPGRSKSRSNKK